MASFAIIMALFLFLSGFLLFFLHMDILLYPYSTGEKREKI
jgi:hypothetical protein